MSRPVDFQKNAYGVPLELLWSDVLGVNALQYELARIQNGKTAKQHKNRGGNTREFADSFAQPEATKYSLGRGRCGRFFDVRDCWLEETGTLKTCRLRTSST
jgi:hypothetical protein